MERDSIEERRAKNKKASSTERQRERGLSESMRGGGGSCVCECVRACLSERENRGEKVRERVGKSRKL